MKNWVCSSLQRLTFNHPWVSSFRAFPFATFENTWHVLLDMTETLISSGFHNCYNMNHNETERPFPVDAIGPASTECASLLHNAFNLHHFQMFLIRQGPWSPNIQNREEQLLEQIHLFLEPCFQSRHTLTVIKPPLLPRDDQPAEETHQILLWSFP